MQRFKLLINNQWVDASSKRTYQVLDPSKNEPVADVALAGEEDIDRDGALENPFAYLILVGLIHQCDGDRPLSGQAFTAGHVDPVPHIL